MTRRRHRWTRRERQTLAAIAAVVFVFGLAGAHKASSSPSGAGAQAGAVISFAAAREGCPYVWGGNGPCGDGYDCSGLVQQDFLNIGITLPRTSEEQWTAGPHVSNPQPGDLVFFAGSDGTAEAPGHVGIVTGPNQMIDAYARGFDVMQQSFGLPSSMDGVQVVVGYTDPLQAS